MPSVLILSPDPAVPGGVSVFIETVKRHLGRYRADSFWVGSSGGRQGLAEAWDAIVRLFAAPARLVRRLTAHPVDVVHLNPSFDAKSLIRDGLILLALRRAGHRRVLVFFHGWDWGVHRRVSRCAPLRRFTAWLLNDVPVIAVLGQAFADGLAELGVTRERIVIGRTLYEPLTDMQARDAGRPFILFLSRFDREKGGRELIEAFAALAEDYPALDLVMAGKGAEDEQLRAKVFAAGLTDRVHFPGYVEGAAKMALLRDCLAFALPTYYRSEGLPVAMLEAMGAGKPLLVGAAGAIASVVADGVQGVLLHEISAASVEDGLRRLLSDAGFASRAGAAGLALAQRDYTADAVTAQIEIFYTRAAAC